VSELGDVKPATHFLEKSLPETSDASTAIQEKEIPVSEQDKVVDYYTKWIGIIQLVLKKEPGELSDDERHLSSIISFCEGYLKNKPHECLPLVMDQLSLLQKFLRRESRTQVEDAVLTLLEVVLKGSPKPSNKKGSTLIVYQPQTEQEKE